MGLLAELASFLSASKLACVSSDVVASSAASATVLAVRTNKAKAVLNNRIATLPCVPTSLGRYRGLSQGSPLTQGVQIVESDLSVHRFWRFALAEGLPSRRAPCRGSREGGL